MQIKEATQCTASAGIGPNMLLAKLATTRAKPDGIFRIRPGAEVDTWVTIPLLDFRRIFLLCPIVT